MADGQEIHVPPVADRQGVDEISVFGFRFHPRTAPEVIDEVEAAVVARRRLIMANANLHALAVMYESPRMSGLLTQPDTVVMIDSMPILFLANVLGDRLSRSYRTTSLDFYDDLFRLGVARGWRFGFVGATPQILSEGLEVLRCRFPGLDIDGRSGFFDIDDTSPDSGAESVIAWLNARSHDVVIVGMGMPRQEEWIVNVQNRVNTRVFMPAGAYLDYQVGAQKPAPRWIGQMGFEWAYRLLHSPRRLSYRYLIEPIRLAVRLLTHPHPQRRKGRSVYRDAASDRSAR